MQIKYNDNDIVVENNNNNLKFVNHKLDNKLSVF